MIRIIGTGAKANVSVIIGDYIPVTITFKVGNFDNLYWRVGNKDKSLLEIAFHETTGEIIEIELVNANKLSICNEPIISYSGIPDTGIPLIDLSSWKTNEIFIEDRRDIELCLTEQYLYIDIRDILMNYHSEYHRVIANQTMHFFINNSTMSIDIIRIELNNSDRERIKNYYKRKVDAIEQTEIKWK